jgi:hypothetical protein
VGGNCQPPGQGVARLVPSGALVVVRKGAAVNSRHVELDPFEEMPPSVRVALGRSDEGLVTLPDAERRIDLWLDDELR